MFFAKNNIYALKIRHRYCTLLNNYVVTVYIFFFNMEFILVKIMEIVNVISNINAYIKTGYFAIYTNFSNMQE